MDLIGIDIAVAKTRAEIDKRSLTVRYHMLSYLMVMICY